MGKNQSASNLTNVIQYSNGNITFVSGSTTLMSISSSGAITTTGVISGSNALSASYAANADTLDGLDSTVFTLTSSFNAFSSSILAQTASLNSFSASILATTASLNLFSSSVLTFTGSAATRLGALESYTSSLNNKTASFATTGSNTFIGTQTISGSVLQSGSFTTTGTIIAQTINVQTVTSSIVYSSGSNIFGNLLNNTQTFTGSVLITGSLTIAGASSATSYSGTTIYGSTAVCSPVGKFTSCIDAGSGTFSGNVVLGTTALSGGGAAQWITANGTAYGGGLISSVSGVIKAYYYYDNSANAAMVQAAAGVGVQLWANNAVALTITCTGTATFSSTITGTTIYGSTAVCSPSFISSGTICSTGNTCFGGMSIINNCLGIGTATPQFKLDIQGGSLGIYHNTNYSGGASGAQLYLGDMNFAGGGYACSAPGIGAVCSPSTGVAGDLAFYNYTGIVGCRVERMRIAGGNVGIGTFTPTDKLDIYGNDTNGAIVVRGGSSQTGRNIYLFSGGISATGTLLGVTKCVNQFIYSNNSRLTIGTGDAYSLGFSTSDTLRAIIDSSGIACFSGTVCAPAFYAGTYLAVNRAGADGVGEGPYLVISQPSQSKQWVQQLNASAGLDYWHYNGSAWSIPLKLTSAGSTCFACPISVPRVFQRPDDLTVTCNMTGFRSLNLAHQGAAGYIDINPVRLFGLPYQGGLFFIQITTWQRRYEYGIINWVDNGSNVPIVAVNYTTISCNPGVTTPIQISATVPNPGSDNIIRIYICNMHSNGHGYTGMIYAVS